MEAVPSTSRSLEPTETAQKCVSARGMEATEAFQELVLGS
eukprot:COSAG05_NODE_16066_length_354_cov_0.807843_2_plen_39_part_01